MTNQGQTVTKPELAQPDRYAIVVLTADDIASIAAKELTSPDNLIPDANRAEAAKLSGYETWEQFKTAKNLVKAIDPMMKSLVYAIVRMGIPEGYGLKAGVEAIKLPRDFGKNVEYVDEDGKEAN